MLSAPACGQTLIIVAGILEILLYDSGLSRADELKD